MKPAACLHLALAATLALESCAAAPQLLPPTGRPAPALRHGAATRPKIPLTITFKIPQRRRRTGHGAKYLSPSTGSIVLTVFDAAHVKQLAQTELDTVPGLNGCTLVSNGSFTCPMSLKLAPGSYAFDVATYDAFGGKGVALSALKDYVKSIVAGKSNSLKLTLYGIPVLIDFGFAGTSKLTNNDLSGNLAMAGLGSGAAQQLQLSAEDGDGNIIVGSGAPSFALIGDQPSNLTIAPVSGSSGLFRLTPLHHTTAGINLTLEAIAGDSAASPIYAHATLNLDQLVYVADPGNGSVTGFAPWSSTAVITIPSSAGAPNPYTLALDSGGNLYVENFQVGAGKILVFPPGSTTPSRTISGLSAPAFGLAIDASGDIFVSEYTAQDVKEFTPSGGGTPSRTLSSSTSPTGINKPEGLAVDSSGNLYVANGGGTIGVSVYAPGTSTTPSAVFHTGMSAPAQLAFDAGGNLYVSNNGGTSVTEYAPPFSSSSTVLHTFSNANTLAPFAVAVDGSNNVWVGATNNSGVTGVHMVEFASAGSVKRDVSGYGAAVYGIAVDGSGNGFVTDNSGNKVDEFSPSSGTTPVGALSSGVSTPTSIAIW
jgi:streptogramin lyase